MSKAIAAGKLKKRLSSNALFCIFITSILFSCSINFDNLGKTTVLIAIPAIAKLI